MIGKICKRGATAKGVVRYINSDRKEGSFDVVPLDAALLDAPSLMRPDVQKPIWHAALSLPEGESLDASEWHKLLSEYMEKMGFADHEWGAVVHCETDHQHAHIVANRIGYDGTLNHCEHDVRKSIKLTRELEKEFGLSPVSDTLHKQTAPTQNEIEKAGRTGEPVPRLVLQSIVADALAGSKNIQDFMAHVESKGVVIRANVATTGKVNGLSFEYDGIEFKASQLSKNYGWKQLSERLKYEQTRDSAAVSDRSPNRIRDNGTNGATAASRRDPDRGIDRSTGSNNGRPAGTELETNRPDRDPFGGTGAPAGRGQRRTKGRGNGNQETSRAGRAGNRQADSGDQSPDRDSGRIATRKVQTMARGRGGLGLLGTIDRARSIFEQLAKQLNPPDALPDRTEPTPTPTRTNEPESVPGVLRPAPGRSR